MRCILRFFFFFF